MNERGARALTDFELFQLDLSFKRSVVAVLAAIAISVVVASPLWFVAGYAVAFWFGRQAAFAVKKGAGGRAERMASRIGWDDVRPWLVFLAPFALFLFLGSWMKAFAVWWEEHGHGQTPVDEVLRALGEAFAAVSGWDHPWTAILIAMAGFMVAASGLTDGFWVGAVQSRTGQRFWRMIPLDLEWGAWRRRLRERRKLYPGGVGVMGRCVQGAGARVFGWVVGAAVALSAGAGLVSAGERAASVVEQLRQSGASVTALGKRGAMDGWWVEPAAGEAYALYVDETGHAVLGTMYAPDGAGVTARQLEAMRAAGRDAEVPVLSAFSAAPQGATGYGGEGTWAKERSRAVAAPAALLEAGMAAEGFELGESGPQVVTFADPACPPSRAAVAMLARRAVDGELRLKVVPVAMLGDRSARLAGAVLASENRALAWFSADREGTSAGGGAAAGAAVDLNGRLFLRSGSEFVPWSLLKSADGAVSSAVGLDFEVWFGAGQ